MIGNTTEDKIKLIERLKRESVRFHPNASTYSLVEIECIESAKIVYAGWLNIGDIELEILKLKGIPISESRKSKVKWVRLNSWKDKCIEYIEDEPFTKLRKVIDEKTNMG